MWYVTYNMAALCHMISGIQSNEAIVQIHMVLNPQLAGTPHKGIQSYPHKAKEIGDKNQIHEPSPPEETNFSWRICR